MAWARHHCCELLLDCGPLVQAQFPGAICPSAEWLNPHSCTRSACFMSPQVFWSALPHAHAVSCMLLWGQSTAGCNAVRWYPGADMSCPSELLRWLAEAEQPQRGMQRLCSCHRGLTWCWARCGTSCCTPLGAAPPLTSPLPLMASSLPSMPMLQHLSAFVNAMAFQPRDSSCKRTCRPSIVHACVHV